MLLQFNIAGPPPYFTMSPSNQTVTANHNVKLSCKANNTLSYIWDRQNGSIPSGATGRNTDTLILVNVQPKDSGSYRCVATNNYGTNISDYATVIIKSISHTACIYLPYLLTIPLICNHHPPIADAAHLIFSLLL